MQSVKGLAVGEETEEVAGLDDRGLATPYLDASNHSLGSAGHPRTDSVF